jgi:orotidine-5'-phosphate decarboxylase
VKTENGRTFSEMLADTLRPLAASPGMLGQSGWSSLGAVVGATQAHTIQSLRERLPNSIFLLPGYGTQGASAEMTRAAFRDGQGAIVSASRSILYAHRDQKHSGHAWDEAVKKATLEMRSALSEIV